MDFRRHRRTRPRGKKKNGVPEEKREGILKKMNLKNGIGLGAIVQLPRMTKIDRQDRMELMKVKVKSAVAMNRVPNRERSEGPHAMIAMAVGDVGVAGVGDRGGDRGGNDRGGPRRGGEEPADDMRDKNADGADERPAAASSDTEDRPEDRDIEREPSKRRTLNSASKAT